MYTRVGQHLSSLPTGRHKNIKLQELWNTYGPNNFKFEILKEVIGTVSDLLEAETKCIQELCPTLNIMQDSTINIGDYMSLRSKKLISDTTDQ